MLYSSDKIKKEIKWIKFLVYIKLQGTSILEAAGISNIGMFGESLIKEADDCLYYSKENGRDKITIT